jgi:hypothetical protein
MIAVECWEVKSEMGQKTTPKGFERLGLWPVDMFDKLAPPRP